MYLKKSAINAMNGKVVTCIIIAIVTLCLWAIKPTSIVGAERIQNIMVVQYFRNYSVTLYNGKVDTVNLDWHVYNIDNIIPQANSEISACDSIDENNEEGQTCVLFDTINMWLFLNSVGYTP